MAYDPSVHAIVAFGAYYYSGSGTYVANNFTWAYANGSWTRLALAVEPPARTSASLTYDAADGYLLLFGGMGPSCGAPACTDTWELAGGRWTEAHPSTVPRTYWWTSAAYDAKAGYIVLVAETAAGISTTWRWTGTTWAVLVPAKASPPIGKYSPFALAYDSSAGSVILASSFNQSCPWGVFSICVRTWSFANGTWTEISSLPPIPTFDLALANDPGVQGVVLYASVPIGLGSSSRSETWILHAGTWIRSSPTTSPPPLWSGPSAYDPTGGILLLIGGVQSARGTPEMWSFG